MEFVTIGCISFPSILTKQLFWTAVGATATTVAVIIALYRDLFKVPHLKLYFSESLAYCVSELNNQLQKSLRIKVENYGRDGAKNVEGRLEAIHRWHESDCRWNEDNSITLPEILHWTGRDPKNILMENLSIKRDSYALLNICYTYSNTNYLFLNVDTTIKQRNTYLHDPGKYKFKISVYCDNGTPESIYLLINWSGSGNNYTAKEITESE